MIGNKIQKYQKFQNRIIQKVINEYDRELPKDKGIYLKKNDKKLLMVWGLYNNIIILYQNLINNTTNQPSKFRTKISMERDKDSPQTYSTSSQIKLKLQC